MWVLISIPNIKKKKITTKTTAKMYVQLWGLGKYNFNLRECFENNIYSLVKCGMCNVCAVRMWPSVVHSTYIDSYYKSCMNGIWSVNYVYV